MPPEHKLRVFLDTNVIFSGLYSPDGAPGIILEQFIKGRLEVVISQQVLEEVVRTVQELLPEALPALRQLLLSSPPQITKDPTPEEVKRWAEIVHVGDAAIFAAAVAAQPDYFITGDRHFISNPQLVRESGLRIITPAQLLGLLKEQL